jgi:hypothetical protein
MRAVGTRAFSARAPNQLSPSWIGSRAIRPQHEQLPMAIHSFHRFIHSSPQGMDAISTASTGRPGGPIVDNTRSSRHAIDSPKRCPSEVHCPTKHLTDTRVRCGGLHRGPPGVSAAAPRIRSSDAYYLPRFPWRSQHVMIAITKNSCDSPHWSEVDVLVKGD